MFPTKVLLNKNLHTEEISNHVAQLAKNKRFREIVNRCQKKLLRIIKKFV